MRIGLDPNSKTTFTMYRARQEDMTVAIAENLVEKELPDRLTQFLEASKTKPTIRRFEFSSIECKFRTRYEEASTLLMPSRSTQIPGDDDRIPRRF